MRPGLLAAGHPPAAIAVPAHAHPVIDDPAVGQEDLRIAPAARARAPAVTVAGVDHAAHAGVGIAPVIGLAVTDRGVERIAVLAAIALADGRAEPGPDQPAGQIPGRIAVAGDAAQHRPDQGAGQDRVPVGPAEPVGVDEAAAGVAVVIAPMIPPAVTRSVMDAPHMGAMVNAPVDMAVAAVRAAIIAMTPAVLAEIAAVVAALEAVVTTLVAMVDPVTAAVLAHIAAPVAAVDAMAPPVLAHVVTRCATVEARIAAVIAPVEALIGAAMAGIRAPARAGVPALGPPVGAGVAAQALLNSFAARALDPVGPALRALAAALLGNGRGDSRLRRRGGDQARRGRKSEGQNGAGE